MSIAGMASSQLHQIQAPDDLTFTTTGALAGRPTMLAILLLQNTRESHTDSKPRCLEGSVLFEGISCCKISQETLLLAHVLPKRSERQSATQVKCCSIVKVGRFRGADGFSFPCKNMPHMGESRSAHFWASEAIAAIPSNGHDCLIADWPTI
jgi:hypothetical protein